MELQAPVIISSASEGGAELFTLPYFEKQAFLAQSPQLYKQMGAISFEKVFMVVPVFRAEKFDQPTHLNEIRQMDIEQAFSTDEDVMKVLEEVFVHILRQVSEECEDELKILGRELKIPKLPLKRITYTHAIELLKKNKEKIEWGEDFSKTQEKLLTKLVGEHTYFVKDWPTAIKAFYAFPYEDNPKICRAFDLIYDGVEVCSGTQRIHIPELLTRQLKTKGLNPDNFKYYIDAFRFGSPIHSGWSIGLERLSMEITGRSNIKEVTMFPRDRNRITP
jgi:aspartyl-tRNA synthetase